MPNSPTCGSKAKPSRSRATRVSSTHCGKRARRSRNDFARGVERPDPGGGLRVANVRERPGAGECRTRLRVDRRRSHLAHARRESRQHTAGNARGALEMTSREAWSGQIQAVDYESQMSENGQAQANAELVYEWIEGEAISLTRDESLVNTLRETREALSK